MTVFKRIKALLLCTALLATSVFVSACSDSSKNADFSKSSTEFVSQINCGWNLGNTLESTPKLWSELPENYSAEDVMTSWNNPVVTQKQISAVAEKGFNAIRIPVTYHLFVEQTDKGEYTIKQEWLDMVKEVVDYCYKENMFIIVDMHHDDKDWLSISCSDEEFAAVKEEYRQLWTIIANEFKDYNEKLIFEAANEIVWKVGENSDWWGNESYEFNEFDRLNELYTLFVETVRATGSNNEHRYLMLPTYGAQWYSHQIEKLDVFGIAENGYHLICDIHWYTNSTDSAEIDGYMKTMSELLLEYEIPVIIGECGLSSKSQTDKVAWAKNFFGTANNYGIKCFIWDDGGDYMQLDRNSLTWTNNEYVDTIVKTAEDAVQTTTAAQ